jgi:hypothetical protein
MVMLIATSNMVPVLSSVVSGLAGAVVGGFITARSVSRQTQDTIRATAALAAREAAEDRRRQRRAVAVNACVELLEVLVAVEQAVPALQQANRFARKRLYDQAGAAARPVLEQLRRAELALAPAIDNQAVRTRVRHLGAVASQLSTSQPVGSDATKLQRAGEDVVEYVAYVRRTITAYIDDEPLPPDAQPPVLHRNDGAVWTAPDGTVGRWRNDDLPIPVERG